MSDDTQKSIHTYTISSAGYKSTLNPC